MSVISLNIHRNAHCIFLDCWVGKIFMLLSPSTNVIWASEEKSCSRHQIYSIKAKKILHHIAERRTYKKFQTQNESEDCKENEYNEYKKKHHNYKAEWNGYILKWKTTKITTARKLMYRAMELTVIIGQLMTVQ